VQDMRFDKQKIIGLDFAFVILPKSAELKNYLDNDNFSFPRDTDKVASIIYTYNKVESDDNKYSLFGVGWGSRTMFNYGLSTLGKCSLNFINAEITLTSEHVLTNLKPHNAYYECVEDFKKWEKNISSTTYSMTNAVYVSSYDQNSSVYRTNTISQKGDSGGGVYLCTNKLGCHLFGIVASGSNLFLTLIALNGILMICIWAHLLIITFFRYI